MNGTLAKFFDDVAAGIGIGPGVERATVVEIHAGLAAELAEIADALPPGAAPIVLTKNRIRNVLACETGALASEAESTEMNAALMLGLLVDRLVATFVLTGSVPADAYATAVEAVRAERDERALSWLEVASPEDLDGLREDLAERAERIIESWPAVAATWWPRLEDRVTLPFADGKVLLSGRFDLLAGGAPTPVERVIVEVKAGTATAVHQPDLYWYGLLGALRDHVAPRAVAVWSAADGKTTTAPISAGSLESAAMRVGAAARRWIELNRGREPTLSPHPGCRWCPALPECATGQAWSPDE